MSDNCISKNVDYFEEDFLIAVAALDDDDKQSKKKYAPGCGCMTLIIIIIAGLSAALLVFL